MLQRPTDVEPGQIVYLTPHTRTAGQYCWMKKAAAIEDAKTHWPRVQVSLTHKGEETRAYVHKDDILLNPPSRTTKTDVKQGDSTTGQDTATRVRVMPGRIKEIDLPADMEQGELF